MRIPVALLLVAVIALAPMLIVPACQAVLEAVIGAAQSVLDGTTAVAPPG